VQARDNNEFICRMKDYLLRSFFIEKTTKAFETYFPMQPMSLDTNGIAHKKVFVHTTSLLAKQELLNGLAFVFSATYSDDDDDSSLTVALWLELLMLPCSLRNLKSDG
jgi:hypothetical protein